MLARTPFADRQPPTLGVALGAVALGALAVGAIAVGYFAVKKLDITRAHIRRLEVDNLLIRRLYSAKRLGSGSTQTDARDPWERHEEALG